MKLSKQERIGVLIIAVILILGLGIYFFVVPKFTELDSAQKRFESKNKEYAQVVEKASLKAGLKDSVIEAYDNGRNLADMFFQEMTPYEVDNQTREFLEYARSKDINFVVEAMSVSPASVSTLGVSFFDEPEISYGFKTYATQGQQPTEEEKNAAARRSELMSALSSTQEVAANTVSFDVTTETIEELLRFVDVINEYEKSENGKMVRKAMMLNGLSIEFFETVEKYEPFISDIEAKAAAEAEKELKAQWGKDAAVGNREDDKNANQSTDGAQADNNEEEKEGTKTIVDSIYTMTVNITYYSVERMLDPIDILNAQDAA